MGSLFSPDSAPMKFMSRVADLIILNALYIITCIPIITIGAANTAMYSVCFRMGTVRENGVVAPYFKAFKENFKQSTIAWLILLVIGFATYWNTFIFIGMKDNSKYMCIPFIFLFFVLWFVGAYTFPLISQFDNDKVTQVLKNAFMFSFKYLPRTILMTALNILPFVILWISPMIFLILGFIWFLIYFGAVTYFNSRRLQKVFKPYMPEDFFKPDEYK